MKKALILASGGIDSLTVIGMCLKKGYEVTVLSFDYGQNNLHEISCLKKSILQFKEKINHILMKLDFSLFNSGLLNSKPIETYKDIKDLPPTGKPNTYVPGRNTIFTSYACGLAESLGIFDIFLGIHKQDAGNYPDCTNEYLKAFNNLVKIGIDEHITIHAPLIDLDKSQIVEMGINLGIDYSNTISCYNPKIDDNFAPCKQCHACIIRKEAFKKNNLNLD